MLNFNLSIFLWPVYSRDKVGSYTDVCIALRISLIELGSHVTRKWKITNLVIRFEKNKAVSVMGGGRNSVCNVWEYAAKSGIIIIYY